MARFGRQHFKFTARSPEQVMQFVETVDHHIASNEEEGFLTLKGHACTIRIPDHIREQCFIKSAHGTHDDRMYRWDHKAAAAAAGWLWEPYKRERGRDAMTAAERDEIDPIYGFRGAKPKKKK